MCVHLIQNLERSFSQQQVEVEHLQNQLRDLRQQAEADKDALKKATRAQKQRAQRSEDTVGQLSAQLLEIVSWMSLLLTQILKITVCYNKCFKPKYAA